MVFNAIINNKFSYGISWMSVLSIEKPGVSGENHTSAASH